MNKKKTSRPLELKFLPGTRTRFRITHILSEFGQKEGFFTTQVSEICHPVTLNLKTVSTDFGTHPYGLFRFGLYPSYIQFLPVPL